MVGDEKYEEMTLQLEQVNGDADSVQSDLENKLAAIPLQRQQEEQAVEEWRKQRDALSQAEAEVERLQAEMSRLNATKEWLQQALSRAKKPEPRPQQGTPFSSPPAAGGSGAASSSSVPPSGSVSKEQLRQKLTDLKELLKDELIDEDDYKQQKTELMTFFQAAQ